MINDNVGHDSRHDGDIGVDFEDDQYASPPDFYSDTIYFLKIR